MEIQGRVLNGVVVLEHDVPLPEGAVVSVVYPSTSVASPQAEKRRIQLPLVRCQQPGSVHLSGQRIAELMDGEDVAP